MIESACVTRLIQQVAAKEFVYFSDKELLNFALSCIDLTTLEGSNTMNDILSLCEKAAHYYRPTTASVCLFPIFCAKAKNYLKKTKVKVACVAGGFPAGQIPIGLKIAEVEYLISEGVDEIDLVISRGKFLEGNYTEVFDEIAAVKEVCKDTILKVILEVGELQSVSNIYKASEIAIDAGADFIKTSTGKIAVNASPESFTTMLLAVKKHYEQTGKQVGVKVSGGVTNELMAKQYIHLLYEILGEKWMNQQYFRIGASRLADNLYDKIKQLK
ncbi:MAG TPA: deoxyribose-phosphate aldolase [Bacteroidales bacterium]|nr:deoxyribose-phosphate aldolase [Bacteroidales bacterium]HOR82765.1 deoxyribose-phosphate aldolase [Bacteroidales bacterium]HPJ91981.1 deoxyribose-phosphate aldolase [Bacteroidales bacterium]